MFALNVYCVKLKEENRTMKLPDSKTGSNPEKYIRSSCPSQPSSAEQAPKANEARQEPPDFDP